MPTVRLIRIRFAIEVETRPRSSLERKGSDSPVFSLSARRVRPWARRASRRRAATAPTSAAVSGLSLKAISTCP